MQRQVVGINFQLETVPNQQMQMGISTKNNTERNEEVAKKLAVSQTRIDKLEAEKEINNEGNQSLAHPSFSGSFGEEIMVGNEEATVQQPFGQAVKQSSVIRSTKSGNIRGIHSGPDFHYFLYFIMFWKVIFLLGQFTQLYTCCLDRRSFGNFKIAAKENSSFDILKLGPTVLYLYLFCNLLLNGLVTAIL
jgi:hypothetical protein